MGSGVSDLFGTYSADLHAVDSCGGSGEELSICKVQAKEKINNFSVCSHRKHFALSIDVRLRRGMAG